MHIHLLSEENSLLQQFVSELRDAEIQKDRLRFRRNIERIGQIMAYEVSKKMPWTHKDVVTPLGVHRSRVLAEQPVLATILRAGLSMHHGILEYFDRADCAFISAYRRHDENDHRQFDIVVEYLATPEINDRILFLIDPMLATGQSIELTYRALLEKGTPKELHILALIASQEGIDYLREKMPEATLWIADSDPVLNEYGYIVPGLGDAGDLCYGEKIRV